MAARSLAATAFPPGSALAHPPLPPATGKLGSAHVVTSERAKEVLGLCVDPATGTYYQETHIFVCGHSTSKRVLSGTESQECPTCHVASEPYPNPLVDRIIAALMDMAAPPLAMAPLFSVKETDLRIFNPKLAWSVQSHGETAEKGYECHLEDTTHQLGKVSFVRSPPRASAVGVVESTYQIRIHLSDMAEEAKKSLEKELCSLGFVGTEGVFTLGEKEKISRFVTRFIAAWDGVLDPMLLVDLRIIFC